MEPRFLSKTTSKKGVDRIRTFCYNGPTNEQPVVHSDRKRLMQKQNLPTLRDVARMAGVNKVTASVVLNGARSGTRVSEATRQRVLTAAKEIGYHPNSIARALAQRRTNIIGIYFGYGFSDPRHPFIAEISAGLQEGCNQHCKDLLIHGTFRGTSVDEIYSELSNGKVDGLVLYTPLDDPLVQKLAASHLPVIALADPVPSLPSVGVDDVTGSRLLAQHLASKGHRRVLYRNCPVALPSVVRRFAAFREAASASSMTLIESISGPIDSVAESDLADREKQPRSIAWKSEERTLQHGLSRDEEQILQLSPEHRPTAIACWEDGVAEDTLAECARLGLRVPEDMAIVGFNGIIYRRGPGKRLTTIDAHWSDVARTAVSLVVETLEGKPAPQETILPVDLLVGDTT